MYYAVILAGGIGERLWPKSREMFPKHLQPIVGDKTMFQQTIDRITGVVEVKRIYVVTSESQREIILEQVPNLPSENIIGEPFGRNTAAAIGVAAAIIHKKDPDAVMLSLHSDHYIHDSSAFCAVIKDVFDVAGKNDALCTIGIKPSFANTGYGYIHRKEKLDFKYKTSFYETGGFKEKPDIETAMKYVDSGNYYWNSGMFTWKTSVILEEIRRNMPVLYDGCIKISNAYGTESFGSVFSEVYRSLESVPIDTGIMEKADNVIVAESIFDWDDVGSWLSIEKYLEKDAKGNSFKGAFIQVDSNNCIVNSESMLIALAGVNDLIIVQTKDAILVCSKGKAQEIRKLTQIMKNDPALGKYL